MRVNVQLIDAETGTISGPNGSISPSPTSSTCRTKSSRAWRATARRTRQPPRRDALNGPRTPTRWTSAFKVWLGFIRVRLPDNLAQARSFFDRALAADPDNVDSLIGSAAVYVVVATPS